VPDTTLDAEIQAEIEAEFAELTAEISRINALPETPAPEKVALLEALRTQWRSRERPQATEDDRPAWRRSIDDAVTAAVDGLLDDGLRVGLDGDIQFDLQGESLKLHGQPVVDALLGGLRATLSERFPAIDAAAKSGVDPGRMLMATLLGGLEQAVRSAAEAKPTAPDPTEDPEETNPEAGPPTVKMNVDFSKLIGALLKPAVPATDKPDPDDEKPS